MSLFWQFIHFASASIAVIFSQLMASSTALWRLNKPPSSFVSGHESTMCSMDCCSPQSQGGDEARPHLCMLARHGPWLVRKQFNSVQEWRGRSKPGCWIVGSHTRWILTTAADNQSSSHCALWSTGVASAQIGRRATSRFCGWSNTSAYRGQFGWASMLQSSLSVADLRRRAREAMLASTGSYGVCVGRTQPDIRHIALLSWESTRPTWLDLNQTGQQYSMTNTATKLMYGVCWPVRPKLCRPASLDRRLFWFFSLAEVFCKCALNDSIRSRVTPR